MHQNILDIERAISHDHEAIGVDLHRPVDEVTTVIHDRLRVVLREVIGWQGSRIRLVVRAHNDLRSHIAGRSANLIQEFKQVHRRSPNRKAVRLW